MEIEGRPAKIVWPDGQPLEERVRDLERVVLGLYGLLGRDRPGRPTVQRQLTRELAEAMAKVQREREEEG